MKYCIFFALIVLASIANGEPSAFEKQSGVTKNDIKALQSIVTQLQQKVEAIGQTQEGISSLYESQNTKLQRQITQTTQQTKDIEELKTQLDLLHNLKQEVTTNTQEIQKLKTQIQEINTHLTTLNQTILNELKKLNTTSNSSQKNTDKDNTNHISDTQTKNPPFNKDKTKKAEIFAQAQELFNKKEYESAKERFEWLLTLNYKKPESNFYLGEIAFANKSHNNAIKYYKESAMANDKTKFMPTLLLHTAQSFNAIKDTKNYNKFLDSLIGNYPSSKEAQTAKKLKIQNKEKK